ncbi:MAG: rRNA maturation RNase YbeY [Phycisphaerales bacterium]|nr:rRNA maturation RNase YbeY [Phycisphaerales bacterium]MCB9862809.1 rRNA maturation RNase YbeY [Phycisphaerales bacterium]
MSASEDPSQSPADEPEPESGIDISVSGCTEPLADVLRRAAMLSLTSHGIRQGQLEIAIVEDDAMREQHARWMGEDSTTDSLAFDLRDEPDEGIVDGQLIACESVARRRAAAAGHDWRDELTLYVVHGCLHLCGFDDHEPDDSAEMHAEEDRVLVEMGLPPVFSRGEIEDEGASE